MEKIAVLFASDPIWIEMHYLPGYSPELNPAEMLNNDVKANALGRQRPRSLTHMLASLRGYLHSRQPLFTTTG